MTAVTGNLLNSVLPVFGCYIFYVDFRVTPTNSTLQLQYIERSYHGCKWGISCQHSGKSPKSERWNFTSESLVETKRTRSGQQL